MTGHQNVLTDYLAGLGLVRRGARVSPIGEGLSNVVLLVDDGEARVVVRRPPPPPLPPGAHDVIREARYQQALADTAVPVPRILDVHEDPGLIGVPFYVMEHLAGHVTGAAAQPPFAHPEDHGAMAEAAVDTLVALHRVDPVAHGWVEAGAPPRDAARTLPRLATLLGDELPSGVVDLQDRLATTAPPPRPTVLTHGDFRLGNLMFAMAGPPRVLALLDWELAAPGDPLTDLGYFVATYARPDEPLHALTELSQLTRATGFPTRAALAARYAAATGTPIDELPWYAALALWKVAVLFEYQRRRVVVGHGDPHYARPGLVDGLLRAGEAFLKGDVAA